MLLVLAAARVQADTELADHVGGRVDHPDRLRSAAVGEPNVPVRARRDPERHAARGQADSLITWVVGLIIPTALVVPGSLNHMLPSGPIAIDRTALPGFRPLVNSVTVPPVVICPTAPFRSLNQRFPSGPATTWAGFATRGGELGDRPERRRARKRRAGQRHHTQQ
jgi:hypothetical protein